MMKVRPDPNALKLAFKQRLESDDTLCDLIFGHPEPRGIVWNGGVPGVWDYSKPVLEYGIQDGIDDPRNGYGQRGNVYQIRLMVHNRGQAPGLWDLQASYEILNQADAVLNASPLTVPDHTVYRFWRLRDIPEMTPNDTQGYVYPAVGALYEVRIYR